MRRDTMTATPSLLQNHRDVVAVVVFCAVWCHTFPRSEQGITSGVGSSNSSNSVSGATAWRNADLGTPEFFEWLNTIPPDAAQRLGE